jgi:hypothetical protein
MPATADQLSAAGLIVAPFSGGSTARFDAPLTKGGRIGSGAFGYLMLTAKILPYR